MTDKEVLQKAIEIAIGNGYRVQYYKSFVFSDEIGQNPNYEKYENRVDLSMVFSHDFAKAFFSEFIEKYGGARKYSMDTHYATRGESSWLEDWEYHLMMMVRKSNPIDYLRKFVDNTETSGCPECGAEEVEAETPRTVYSCGSSDYDQRPGTFKQSENCKNA